MNFKKRKPYFSRKSVNSQKYEFQKIQSLDKIQAFRYGFYRKSDFKKEKIKRIVINFNPFLKNINSSDPLIIAIKSLTKAFIGEMIEFSKKVMHENDESVDWKEIQISRKDIKKAFKLGSFKNRFFLLKEK